MALDIGGMRGPALPGGPQGLGGGAPGPGPVDKAGDVGRLEDAMEALKNKPPSGEAQPADEAARAGAEAGAAGPGLAQNPPSVGDRIIKGITSVSDQIQAGRTQAAEALGKNTVTQADLLRAQAAMMESSTLVSAVGKTVEKITQGVKNLQQG